ncbi:putative ankyrin repeat protein [Eutypa lata UCREL1]|uniref:Putative ankyrin repeat protein n=1 Tax=Eutypa lata (strain UCR-EL1) TaxID=1287681 RepID=M7T5F9_EUTLA|nr:putative ankyrin repeat protein [Eutypa lata UCREL1]
MARNLLEMPQEIIKRCVELVPDPKDIFALSRAGNRELYHIAMPHLLESDMDTRQAALYWACMKGDNDLLRRALGLGLSADQCWPGQFDIVEDLLEVHKADPNAPHSLPDLEPAWRPDSDDDDRRPLEWAFAVEGEASMRIRLVELLLDNGADPLLDRTRISLRDSAISQALVNDEIPARILERMIPMDDCLTDQNVSACGLWEEKTHLLDGFKYYEYFLDTRGNRPGIFTSNEMDKLRLMQENALERRPDPVTFLKHALYACVSWEKQLQLVKLTLTHLPEEFHIDTDLMVLAVNGVIGCGSPKYKRNRDDCKKSIRILKALLDDGIDPGQEKEDQNGLTALHHACKWTLINRVKQLLDNGADPNATHTYEGLTPLHYACRIDAPVNPGDRRGFNKSQQGLSPKVRLSITRLLLSAGANPVCSDVKGFMPLHYACKYGFLEVARLLLDTVPAWRNGSNAASSACTTAYDLTTPLHSLSQDPRPDWSSVGRSVSEHFFKVSGVQRRRKQEKAEIAKLLIAAGANVVALDGDGCMPIEHARRHNYWGVVNVLKEHDGDNGIVYYEPSHYDSSSSDEGDPSSSDKDDPPFLRPILS